MKVFDAFGLIFQRGIFTKLGSFACKTARKRTAQYKKGLASLLHRFPVNFQQGGLAVIFEFLIRLADEGAEAFNGFLYVLRSDAILLGVILEDEVMIGSTGPWHLFLSLCILTISSV